MAWGADLGNLLATDVGEVSGFWNGIDQLVDRQLSGLIFVFSRRVTSSGNGALPVARITMFGFSAAKEAEEKIEP